MYFSVCFNTFHEEKETFILNKSNPFEIFMIRTIVLLLFYVTVVGVSLTSTGILHYQI